MISRMYIRKAVAGDVSRIAEIYVFNMKVSLLESCRLCRWRINILRRMKY